MRCFGDDAGCTILGFSHAVRSLHRCHLCDAGEVESIEDRRGYRDEAEVLVGRGD